MKFSIPANGKNVIHKGAVFKIDGGEFETKDKELQDKLLKCKGVSEVKSKSK